MFRESSNVRDYAFVLVRIFLFILGQHDSSQPSRVLDKTSTTSKLGQATTSADYLPNEIAQ